MFLLRWRLRIWFVCIEVLSRCGLGRWCVDLSMECFHGFVHWLLYVRIVLGCWEVFAVLNLCCLLHYQLVQCLLSLLGLVRCSVVGVLEEKVCAAGKL